MKAFVLAEPGKVKWYDAPEPTLSRDGVILSPVAVTPCTSDVHTVYGGGSPKAPNLILGHENKQKNKKMRRLKQTLLALTICTLVISCSLTTSSTIMKVQRGMSQEEVSHLLGKPDFRRFDNGSEQWEYTKTNMSTAANTVIIIDFVDGMVTNMDSFESNITPPPVAVCPPNEIITVVPPSHPDHSGPHRPKHKAMNPHDFENLYKKVKNKAFKDDQMELLSVGVVNNYFTCKQTARLMSIFTWDDEKMKVLRMVSNRIVDRENGKEIIKTLDSLFKQDDARKILGITNQW